MSARILVVEDEEALTTLLRYNLESEGYEVEAVARGDDLGEERVADIGAFGVTLSSPDGTHTLALSEVSP